MMGFHIMLCVIAGICASAAVGLILMSELIRKRRRHKAQLWLVEGRS
jgi:hypothetical protein